MAYSAGFTPHPKVSYANAAPTGVGSEAEYLEIALSAATDPERLRALLDESLPRGLDVLAAVPALTSGFAERLEASVWRVRLSGVDRSTAEAAVGKFLAEDRVEVKRMTKNGIRGLDARSAVVALEVLDATDEQVAGDINGIFEREADRPQGVACAILRLVVRHLTPAVRPDDVLSGLRAVADLAPPVPAEVTRLAQGPLDEESGTVTDPFAPDREAATADPTTTGGLSAVGGAPDGGTQAGTT